MIQGQSAKAAIILPDKYAVMSLKSKASEVKSMATVIPYMFMAGNKEYKGTIGALGKTAEALLTDSVYYLAGNPEINSAWPSLDYERLQNQGMWNWRLYLSIVTGLMTIGSIMKDKKEEKKAA